MIFIIKGIIESLAHAEGKRRVACYIQNRNHNNNIVDERFQETINFLIDQLILNYNLPIQSRRQLEAFDVDISRSQFLKQIFVRLLNK